MSYSDPEFRIGQTVFVLCASVDPEAVTYGGAKPAIAIDSFEWAAFTVIGLSADEVDLRDDLDGSTTSYERRFVRDRKTWMEKTT